jgi:hypothetical protein
VNWPAQLLRELAQQLCGPVRPAVPGQLVRPVRDETPGGLARGEPGAVGAEVAEERLHGLLRVGRRAGLFRRLSHALIIRHSAPADIGRTPTRVGAKPADAGAARDPGQDGATAQAALARHDRTVRIS